MNRIVNTTTGEVVAGARSARFRPKAEHPSDCTCGMCDTAPRDCPHPGCDRVGPNACKGIRGLGAHVAYAHKRRKRSFTRVVVPNGVGWLAGVLRDPHRAAGLHLESLPKFCQWLHEQWHTTARHPRRRTREALRGHRDAANTLAQRSPGEPYTLPMATPVVPAPLAAVMCELAVVAEVPLSSITTALLAYGVEHLARELRASNYAPQPRLPAS